MFWYLLIALCVVLIIVGIVVNHFEDGCSFVGVLITIISAVLLLMFIICVPVAVTENNRNINNFKKQYEYMQIHHPKNDVEDAALTSKKIELNDWLYDSQYSYTHYKFFTLQNEEIMELKPIE